MKRYLKKLGCLVCCLCLAASFWGCKVETVEQHQQAASSQASLAQNSSSKTGAGKEEKDSSKPSGSGKSEPAGSSHQEGQGNEAGESAGENAGKASVPPASNTPEAPAVSQPGSLPSSGAQPQSGGASSAPAEPAPPAPEPEPEPDPETITVTVSVLCTLAVGNPNLNPGVTVPSDGVMVSGLSLELTPGQTAFDALQQTGLALDYSGSPSRKNVYLKGIGGLYERDCGPSSGWVFSVNGAYPNTSCSKVALSDGDVVSFQFTDGTKLN